MANPELGSKQICPNCQAKFYDLNRRPAHCPKCGEEFDPEEAVKSRRIRARAVTPDYDLDEEAEDQVKAKKAASDEEEEDEAAPELDEAIDEEVAGDEDEGEEAAAGPSEDVDLEEDVELEEDEDAVPFLEEEEDADFEDEIEGLPEEGDEDDR